MMLVEPKDYIENYADLREIIAQCRQHFDENRLAQFAVQPVVYDDDPEHTFDEHNHHRIRLLLALATEFNESDKPLIRWLLRENGKCFKFGFDISIETALAAFMLYKHMCWEDTAILYACKFAYGSNEQYMVDTEIALGFGLSETMNYLAKQSDNPIYQEMMYQIQAYCGNNIRLKPREQFIEYFEQRRFGYLQEELARDYGLIDD